MPIPISATLPAHRRVLDEWQYRCLKRKATRNAPILTMQATTVGEAIETLEAAVQSRRRARRDCEPHGQRYTAVTDALEGEAKWLREIEPKEEG